MASRERRLREEKKRRVHTRTSGAVAAGNEPAKAAPLLDRVISRLGRIGEALGKSAVTVREFADSVSPEPAQDIVTDHPARMGRAGSIEDRLDEIDVLLHVLATQVERLEQI